jgi:hypothetical protein
VFLVYAEPFYFRNRAFYDTLIMLLFRAYVCGHDTLFASATRQAFANGVFFAFRVKKTRVSALRGHRGSVAPSFGRVFRPAFPDRRRSRRSAAARTGGGIAGAFSVRFYGVRVLPHFAKSGYIYTAEKQN